MKNLKKLLKIFNRHRIAYCVGAAIVLAIVIGGIAAYAFSNKTQENTQKPTAVKKAEPKKDQATTKETAPVAEATTTPAPATTMPTPPAAQSTPQVKSTPAPKPAPQPAVIPLTVSSIFSWGNAVCSNGAMKLSLIDGTTLYTPAGAVGGTVRWQVETMSGGELRIGQTGTETIAPNEKRHVVAGLAPSDTNSGPDAKIRLHVTSPNDVASSWYTSTVYGGCS
mgnify:CR=1 FL=1